jgi:hypothetical protein
MDERCRDDIPQVTDEENRVLVDNFLEAEVKHALFQMEHNKSSGPDGFLAEFYQVFWDMIKGDLMALFREFHQDSLPLSSLNFDPIILLLKCAEALKIQQYRPICLLNVSFKIFTKVLTNRLTSVAHRVIHPTQTTFLPGRNNMEGVIVLHETIHELHWKKHNGVIFKIVFEKAYDKVKWPFVRKVLEMKGFCSKWCNWIDAIIQEGHVGIKINHQVGQNFQTKKRPSARRPVVPIVI